MKKNLLKDRDRYVTCELDGLKMTYTTSEDPKHHTVVMLKDKGMFDDLKREVNDIYKSWPDKDYGFSMVCEFLETEDCFKNYFTDDINFGYFDIRDREEIEEYEEEAFDKVWLMRNCDISSRRVRNEVAIPNMRRILEQYDDIPKDGYDLWECGYWNGIMGALRWVLGDDRDFLDT